MNQTSEERREIIRSHFYEHESILSETRNKLIADQGSVQNLKDLPQEYKNIYKTIWEIS